MVNYLESDERVASSELRPACSHECGARTDMPVACRSRANDWPWMAISYNPQLRGKRVFIGRMAFTRSNNELFRIRWTCCVL